jgi:hypothetical protein
MISCKKQPVRTARQIFAHAKSVSLANIAALGRLRDHAPDEHRVLIEETLANAIDSYFEILDDEER